MNAHGMDVTGIFLIRMNAPGTTKSTLELSPLGVQLVAAAFPTLTI